MNDEATRKLTWIIRLLALNLIVLFAGAIALIFGLLPRVERAVQTSERVEARFQSFADEVRPVVSEAAGKTIEAVKNLDAERITERADGIMDAATSRAKRFLNKDKAEGERD